MMRYGLFIKQCKLIGALICFNLFILNVTIIFAQGSEKKIPRSNNKKKSESLVFPFAQSEVSLGSSWIKQRELLNTKYIYSLDPDRLLHNFKVNAGLSSLALPLEGWESPKIGLRGHFVGHYLSACSNIINATGDSLLNNRLKYIIDELANCQEKMGGKYLSGFPESDFDTLENKFGGVWAPYYTMHKILQGLLDVYTVTGNQKAYHILLNLVEYISQRMNQLSEDKIDKIFLTTEANPTNEAGGMNEVLHDLFSVSKNPEHLRLAKIFDRKWLYKPLSQGKDILSGLHSNTHVALINGYAKRFDNTNELEFKMAAIHFWDMLLRHHAYVNGSSSGPRPIATTPTSRIAEHWGNANQLSATLTGFTGESCVTFNTQKLTAKLFEWSGNPKYADAYMNSFYNAFMPIQNDLNGRVVYHLPLGSPRRKEFLNENDFKCCNGSSIEAFSKLNTNIFFHNQRDIWVNLFIPSKLSWNGKGISIEQSGDFADTPNICIKVTVKNNVRFELNMLAPSWISADSKVYVNGKQIKLQIKPVSFIKIDRIWKRNDIVELKFKYHYYIKTMPDNPNVIALFYGPFLLAFETGKEIILKGNTNNIVKNISKNNNEDSFILHNNGINYELKPLYKIRNQNYGVYATIRNEF